MNIHPIFVHFPIALMFLYGVMELIKIKSLNEKIYWFYLKAVLVILGSITALPALSTGELAQHLQRNSLPRQLVEIHSTFANISTGIFSIIAFIYLIIWISKLELNSKIISQKYGIYWTKIVTQLNIILNSWTLIFLSVVGLITITITGALGGAIVYGPNVDPIIKFIYNLFF